MNSVAEPARSAVTAVQLAAEPVSVSLVQAIESSQEVGHVDGGFDRGIEPVEFSVGHHAYDFHGLATRGDVPAERVQTVAKVLKPVLDHRVNQTKWVVLRWPSSAMAQQAGMSTTAFEDFYFRVCTFDYRRYVSEEQSRSRGTKTGRSD